VSASVKICGVTTLEDAQAAVEAGARAIGFVFYAKSPRVLTVTQTGAITSQLPSHVKKVGVFVNLHVEQVLDAVLRAGLDMAQLSGDESPEECAWLMERGVKVVKAVRPRNAEDVRRLARYKDKVHAFNVDAYREGQYGGTGHTSDWTLAKDMKAYGKPLILSGGLGAKNVAEAIRAVDPAALDVCSSVEREPGRKDPAKLKLLFEAVRRATEARRSGLESWGPGGTSSAPVGPPVKVLGSPGSGSGQSTPPQGSAAGAAANASSVGRAPAQTPFPAGAPQPLAITPVPASMQPPGSGSHAAPAPAPVTPAPAATRAQPISDDTVPMRAVATPPPALSGDTVRARIDTPEHDAPLVDFASRSGEIAAGAHAPVPAHASPAVPPAPPPVATHGSAIPKAEQSDRTQRTGRRLAAEATARPPGPGASPAAPAAQQPQPAAQPQPATEPPTPPKVKKMGMFDWNADTDRKTKPQ